MFWVAGSYLHQALLFSPLYLLTKKGDFRILFTEKMAQGPGTPFTQCLLVFKPCVAIA